MAKATPQALALYQTKDGALELRQDYDNETLWANKKQIADIFGIDRSVVSRHIKNIFQDKELDKDVVCAYFAQTTPHGAIEGKKQSRAVEFYALDIILAVGYRTNSSKAIEFRQWATRILRDHIVKGFTINSKRIEKNHQLFLNTVEDIKRVVQSNQNIRTDDVLELIKTFSYTWFSLDSYDKDSFPKAGIQTTIRVTAEELQKDLKKLKQELINKKEATDLFAQEKKKGNLSGIVGNVFQSVYGQDAYPTVEEKSAHLLYFIIKNHPFNDGNKRSGAFAFIWFLQKTGFHFRKKITPETLATLTILIAESNPKDKERMIGIILLLLNFKA